MFALVSPVVRLIDAVSQHIEPDRAVGVAGNHDRNLAARPRRRQRRPVSSLAGLAFNSSSLP